MAKGKQSGSVPLDDPTALAKFGKLEVVAKLVVEGYIMGQHKSPFKGASIEFVEHRQYYPGDEIRHIDWRAYGKTGKYYIKEFEDETNLRCYVLVDCSGRMAYGGETIAKFDYARQLAAAMSYLLLMQRDSVGLTTFDVNVRQRLEPSTNLNSFQQMASLLETSKPQHETSLASVFERLLPTMKRRSLVVVISDFYDEVEPLLNVLKQFRSSRHQLILLQVIAPEEIDFPFKHPTQFRSLERAGYKKLVDPHRIRKMYKERFGEYLEQLEKGIGAIGAEYERILTNEPYAKALGAFLDARTRQK
ncbi:MAG: DUF58 domain-containing protein [Planctomycetaceae bacterium]|nr:DUF58 domain-containing protein [Planctomycetaceae bacterium]